MNRRDGKKLATVATFTAAGAPPPAGRVHALLDRVMDIRSTEAAIVAWAGLYIFCLMSSYYVPRPVRDTLGVQGGVDNLCRSPSCGWRTAYRWDDITTSGWHRRPAPPMKLPVTPTLRARPRCVSTRRDSRCTASTC